MKRSPLSSTSFFTEVIANGAELTVQDVPIHRIFATYIQERGPGDNSPMFLNDRENEFAAMLEGLPFDYKGKVVE